MSKLSKVAQGPYAGWSPQTDPYLRRNPPQRPVSYNPDRNILPDLARNASTALRNVAALTLGLPGDFQDISRLKDAPRQLPNSEELAARFGGDVTHPSWLPASFAAPGPGEVKQGLGLLSKVAGNVDPMWAMTLFHGTPHKFDKFSLDKIGTGEGAQAFGHGLYFAENPGVARSYQQSTNPAFADVLRYAGPDHNRQAASLLAADIPDSDVIEGLKVTGAANPEAALAEGKRILADAKASGHLYEVEIPDEITDRMLDWDAPLSEQPESVQRAIESSDFWKRHHGNFKIDTLVGEGPGGQLYTLEPDELMPDGSVRPDLQDFFDAQDINVQKFGNTITGGNFYMRAANRLSDDALMSGRATTTVQQGKHGTGVHQEAVSEELNRLGIPGIRFYDGSSRAAGEGTRNIVVFNPDDITQVKRDGELVFER